MLQYIRVWRGVRSVDNRFAVCSVPIFVVIQKQENGAKAISKQKVHVVKGIGIAFTICRLP